MPGSVTVPSTLKGAAAQMWRETFLSAYDGTCASPKGRKGGKNVSRDACAAKIAWAQVKQHYHKGEDGTWVSKDADPVMGPVSPVEDPAQIGGLEFSIPEGANGTKAQKWRLAFIEAMRDECRNVEKPVECARAKANAAVGMLQERTMNQFSDYTDEYVERREFNTEQRKKMAKSGSAMPDGSFPIANCEDVTNALRSLGRTSKPRDQVVAHIRKRAKELGCKMTPALETKMQLWERYEERKALRKRANEADNALINRIGDQQVVRPDHIGNLAWNRMPPSQKTVRAQVAARIIERNYAQGVEDAQMLDGWKAKLSHYNLKEYIFSKYYDTDAGPILVRAILVRKPDELTWKLKPISTFASGSLAVRIAQDEIRHV